MVSGTHHQHEREDGACELTPAQRRRFVTLVRGGEMGQWLDVECTGMGRRACAVSMTRLQTECREALDRRS